MRDYHAEKLYPHTKVLSSSQFIDYARDPRKFYERWIAGFAMKRSAALEVGSAFAEYYADRSFDYRAYLLGCGQKIPSRLIDVIGEAIKYFPKPFMPEHELIVPFEGWEFRITLDDFYPKQKVIAEHKTSALGWNQETCDTHVQITLQAWGFWKLNGTPPKHVQVNWVDTSFNPPQLVQSFKTKRSVANLEAFEKTVIVPVLKHLESGNFSRLIF